MMHIFGFLVFEAHSVRYDLHIEFNGFVAAQLNEIDKLLGHGIFDG